MACLRCKTLQYSAKMWRLGCVNALAVRGSQDAESCNLSAEYCTSITHAWELSGFLAYTQNLPHVWAQKVAWILGLSLVLNFELFTLFTSVIPCPIVESRIDLTAPSKEKISDKRLMNQSYRPRFFSDIRCGTPVPCPTAPRRGTPVPFPTAPRCGTPVPCPTEPRCGTPVPCPTAPMCAGWRSLPCRVPYLREFEDLNSPDTYP